MKAVSGIMLTLMLISMLTFAFNVQPVSATVYPAVYIEPETTVDPTLTTGDNVTISIKTDYAGFFVWGYEFSLSFDPTILYGVEVANGDLIVGLYSQFLPGQGFNNTEGTLSLVGAYFYYTPPAEPRITRGPGILAYVTFKVIGTGTSDITLGSETKLKGWNPSVEHYDIIDAERDPTHIGHGYFDNLKPIHDIAVTSIVVPATDVVIGQLVSNNRVSVANEGNFTETFDVTVYDNARVVGTQMDVILTRGARTTLNFEWDTTDLVDGNCTVTAEAILAGDADLANNYATTTVMVVPGALNPAPPGYDETSEFLIGSVAVGVILPESNGTIDSSTEDWTSTEESQVVSEIRDGLDWWAAYNPSAGVSFSVEVHYRVPTSYEPISRPSWEDWLWISEAMTYLGYPGTYGWHQVRDYINDLRNRLGTNWAFAIFVADSSNDHDGRFADARYAYAHFGGPYFVMTYDNYRTGIEGMDILTAHEMGHIFYATDEYNGFREYSGYLNASDNDDANCLMNWNVWKLCDATQEQIGWRDTDGDGILDIVDTVPDTTLNPYLPDPNSNRILTYTGSVTVTAYPNRKPFWWPRKNITINTITNVEYRIDNGPWMNATATDGAFDGAQESFTFTTPSLSEGLHKIEVRATNSVGNVEKSYASDIVTILTPVTATVDIYPNTLNLRSEKLWITAYIELPEGYDVSDIDIYSIRLNETIPVGLPVNTPIVVPAEIGDYDNDGIPDLMVKFSRAWVSGFILYKGITYGNVTLVMTGEVDGTPFEGSDTIRVIFPSRKWTSH